MRPALLLDVDGVLNPFFRHDVKYCNCHPGWSMFRHSIFDGTTYKVFYNPQLGRMMQDLAAECDADLYWMTTWEDDANDTFGPRIGLPELPVIPCPPRPRNWNVGGWGAWKAIFAAQWANAQQAAGHARPFVWFDDEAEAAYALEKFTSVPHLVVTVNDMIGLTDHDVERAKVWLQQRVALSSGTG
jgi:HAD domain in Swiss Army Knife RNA repair proteins